MSEAKRAHEPWGSWHPEYFHGNEDLPCGWYVARDSRSGFSVDWMRDADGGLARFDTAGQARAAIDKSTGGAA